MLNTVSSPQVTNSTTPVSNPKKDEFVKLFEDSEIEGIRFLKGSPRSNLITLVSKSDESYAQVMELLRGNEQTKVKKESAKEALGTYQETIKWSVLLERPNDGPAFFPSGGGMLSYTYA